MNNPTLKTSNKKFKKRSVHTESVHSNNQRSERVTGDFWSKTNALQTLCHRTKLGTQEGRLHS